MYFFIYDYNLQEAFFAWVVFDVALVFLHLPCHYLTVMIPSIQWRQYTVSHMSEPTRLNERITL